MQAQEKIHPEQTIENSLTSPADRNPDRSYKPNQGHPQLSEKEVENAMEELNNTDFVRKFLKVERRYADPVDPMQKIGLISFVPAKGATPNDDGVFGFAKLRGNFPTEREASEKAEFIIRNVDSYHQIYHAYVGRPFPITISSKFSAETDEVDVQKSMKETISTSIKNKKAEDKKEIEEIKERERILKEDVQKDEEDPTDRYTTLRVKKAQITWSYLDSKKKLEEMKEIIIKTRKEIEEMEKEDDSYKKDYFERYCKARSESGLENKNFGDNFMKYMVEDAELDF